MTEGNAPGTNDAFWVMGCGMLVAVALTCATLGTFVDIVLVVRTQHHCLGDLSAGEGFAGFVWATSRLLIFPIVAGGSALASLPISLIAHLPWFARHVWLKAVLMLIAVLVAAAGPMAMIVHGVAAEGTPGNCIPPWWPSWLPLQ
ncbi:hypothetical protein HS041_18440 [Planomonospora sp. ID67723]|uniref:hypothetical protein n=1 Tax=Planomonospora sp. ID67723 TaxID=2738134 RepID=UPI0018C3A11A|nr:hypothetical protein [Planomonospora sp. ID67723]MBG0829746.1 hypothetical protein [Planomonospora sp. ID67723]